VIAIQQQVNLYQPAFGEQAKIFCASTLLQIGAVALLSLVIILANARWSLAGMNRTAQMLEYQFDSLNPRLGSLEAAHQTPDTRTLDTEIAQLQADIAERNALLTRFEQLATEQSEGFASSFEVLAREQLPGLWLEGVIIDEDNRVELRGVTLDARLVPAYLQILDRRPDLSKNAFETVSMTRPDARQPQIRFVLRNFKDDAKWN
jgi:hypothetical protein